MPKKITPSKSYWRQREEEQRKKNLEDQKEYDERIKSIYQKAMDNIQKEIDSFYARYARKEGISLAEAKKRASKLDMEEYSRKAKRYVEEKDFSKEANDEMRLYNMTMKANRLELLKANIGLELVDGFNDMQQFFDEKLTDRTVSEFKRQAGILGKTVTETEAANRAKVLVNASFHNAKWSDRIWMHQDLLKGKLDSLLRTGLIQGRNPRELARELRKAFGASRNDSERLMRTEMARVQTAAQKDSFERNGFDRFEYICCGLSDACPACKALDGKKFSVEDMMPGENAPPMHPNCHCSTAAAAADRKDFDAWLDAKAAGETDLGFEEWNKGKNISREDIYYSDGFSKHTVNQLFGRNIKFKTGGASLDDYISQIRIKSLNNSKTDEEKLKELISNGKVSDKLRWAKQNEHIPGTVAREMRKQNDLNNKRTPSSEFLEGIDIKSIFSSEQKHKKMEIQPNRVDIYFDVDKEIGRVYNIGKGKYQNVRRVKIEYSKRGKHAYPVKDW